MPVGVFAFRQPAIFIFEPHSTLIPPAIVCADCSAYEANHFQQQVQPFRLLFSLNWGGLTRPLVKTTVQAI